MAPYPKPPFGSGVYAIYFLYGVLVLIQYEQFQNNKPSCTVFQELSDLQSLKNYLQYTQNMGVED